MICPERTERIDRLRAWYAEHSPVASKGLAPWHVERTMLYYVRGWRAACEAQTVRLRRSMAEKYLMETMEPVIDPGELIAGQPDQRPFTPEEASEYKTLFDLFWHVMPIKRGRADHMALDYEKLLRVGACGLMNEMKALDGQLDLFTREGLEKHEFYESGLIELEGLLTLEKHYADKARAMADTVGEPDRSELLALAETLDQVPAHPARTFREALQSVHFYTFNLCGIYSAGRPDQYLYPYFRRDIDAGMLTLSEAQELIDCFCLQYMTNMCSWAAAGFEVGGRTRGGEAVENELTWLFLNSIPHTRTADPSIGLAVTDETSDGLLRFACQIAADGCTHPAFWNDQGIVDSMLKHGYKVEDARWWTHSTCVEITPIGKSGVSITSPYVNTLDILLKSLRRTGDGADFEELVALYADDLKEHMRREIINENMWQMERDRNGTDPCRASCLIDDCVRLGKSHESGGAPYNFIEPNMLGMMNVTESLNVIHRLVYEEKRLTLGEFVAVLDSDYEGHEDLRRYILDKVTHFGNNDAFSDALGKRVADIALEACAPLRTYRGAEVIPGAFSYREHAIQGKVTGASPDGRRAGMPLTAGSDPVQGFDVSGPTASLLSTAAWQPPRFLGGTAVNIKLAKDTPNLPDVLMALVKSYINLGGSELQINVADAETLRDAQAHPENHRDLLVRIGGYSDFFVRISKELQDEIIRRNCMA